MDYRSAIYKAQENEGSRQSANWYKADFAPPKKEQREKKLSVNIQKFLAKKEEEEKQKKLEAERKKMALLALRSQDKKSAKRVQSMLKRTKSANKSVLEDAIDNVNTAVTAAGSQQPDEDDYGYVSKDAEDLYNQLINKYNSMPSEDSPFKKPLNKSAKDIRNTKDRVKAALQREEDEKLLPKKRKRKSKTEDGGEGTDHDSSGEDSDRETSSESKPKNEKFRIPKKNAQMPPPMDFQALLKLAEEKQHQPIVIPKPVEDKPERPMTKKEKLEYMKERERKLRKEMRVTGNNNHNDYKYNDDDVTKTRDTKVKSETKSSISPSSAASHSSSSAAKKPQKLDRMELACNKRDSAPSSVPSPTMKSSDLDYKKASASTVSDKSKIPQKSVREGCRSDDVKPERMTSKTTSDHLITQFDQLDPREKALLMKKFKEQYYGDQQKKNIGSRPRSDSKDRDRLSMKSADSASGSRHRTDSSDRDRLRAKGSESEKMAFRSAEKTSSKLPEKKSIPNAQPQKSREFPPRDVVRQFQPADVRRKSAPQPFRRRPMIIESDEEYDSEMDDFIDDSEGTTDISKHISEIFGYDRRKYAGVDKDDEDECMESNFSQLQKEEYISAKHGILEDLADVRRTKMEKERQKKRLGLKGGH